RLQLVLDEPAPPVAHAHHLVPALERPTSRRADDRIQARTIAAAGENPDPLRHRRDHAEGGSRTHTRLSPHRILSPARLPVPPLRRTEKSSPVPPLYTRRSKLPARSPSPHTCAQGQGEVEVDGGGHVKKHISIAVLLVAVGALALVAAG